MRISSKQKRLLIVLSAVICAVMVMAQVATVYATPYDDFLNTGNDITAIEQELAATMEQLRIEQSEHDVLKMQNDELVARIDALQKQMDDLDFQIMNVEDELDAAETEFADMMCMYTSRIRSIEEYGTSSYWAILFQSTSLVDLLGRIDYVCELMATDERAISIVDTRIESLDEQREELESLRADRHYMANQLHYTQDELAKRLDEKAKVISELGDLTSAQKAELERLENEAMMLRRIASDDAVFLSEDADSIYQRFIVSEGLDKLYPSGCEAVRRALEWLGTAYVWGGESPSEGGFDCSGLMYYIYKNMGYTIERVGSPQYYYSGVYVENQESLHPGDMIFFKNTYKSGLSHVAMYISNGVFIHAANPRAGIKISSLVNDYWSSRYVGAKRIVAE